MMTNIDACMKILSFFLLKINNHLFIYKTVDFFLLHSKSSKNDDSKTYLIDFGDKIFFLKHKNWET